MATNTTNYSLTKPAYTDTADIADINGNMDTVDSALTKLCNDLAIVEFGDNSTHSISNGSFVVWKGDLYVANQNISNGAALSGKLTAVANGGLNNLNNLYNTLNSNMPKVKHGSVNCPAVTANSYSTIQIDFDSQTSDTNYSVNVTLSRGTSTGAYPKGFVTTLFGKTKSKCNVLIYASEAISADAYTIDWILIE